MKSGSIVFFGDSISAAGRSRLNPWGDGFVSMVTQQLQSHSIKVINAGINGNTVQDLLDRVERDVLNLDPDHIFIEIGINDAWNDTLAGCLVENMNSFIRDYQKLLAILSEQCPRAQITLISPYYISDSRHETAYVRMQDYIQAVRDLALACKIDLLDFQNVFDSALQHTSAAELADDRIHPGRLGHGLLAREVLAYLAMD